MTRLAPPPLTLGRPTPNGSASNGARAKAGTVPRGPTRRNLPLVALGVLLVVGCAIGFSSAWLRAGGRQQVLVLANDLSTGQILTSSDLKAVQITGGSGLATVPAAEEPEMVGRPVAQAVGAGALLTASDIGPSTGPPSGRAMVGLALKPGQYPPGVAAGEHVLVVLNGGGGTGNSDISGSTSSGSSSFGSSTAEAPLAATVVGVEQAPANSSESVIVSVQVAEGNGAAVASAASAGNVALAVVSTKGAS